MAAEQATRLERLRVSTRSSGTKSAVRNRSAAKRGTSISAKWNLRRAGGLQTLEAPALARFNWLIHGFSTRPGGASELKAVRDGHDTFEEVLNLGFTDWDTKKRVRDNREKFFRAIGASKMRIVALRQMHSDIVQVVDSANESRSESDSRGAAPQGWVACKWSSVLNQKTWSLR